MVIALFVSVAVALIVPFLLFAPQWQAAEEKARARRMAGHRMDARLLRMDI